MAKYENKYEDTWFNWKGVPPPERISHGITEDESEARVTGLPHVCHWKQSGGYIICNESPEYEHGINIGINKRLTGTGTKGEPLLADIVLNK